MDLSDQLQKKSYRELDARDRQWIALVYYDGWKAGRHVEQFGVKQVRVLTVTSSAKRVENMLATVDEITEGRGSNFFLFMDRARLIVSDPLNAEWVSGKGERVKLID